MRHKKTYSEVLANIKIADGKPLDVSGMGTQPYDPDHKVFMVNCLYDPTEERFLLLEYSEQLLEERVQDGRL